MFGTRCRFRNVWIHLTFALLHRSTAPICTFALSFQRTLWSSCPRVLNIPYTQYSILDTLVSDPLINRSTHQISSFFRIIIPIPLSDDERGDGVADEIGDGAGLRHEPINADDERDASHGDTAGRG